MIEGVGVLVLDLAMELGVAALCAFEVGVILCLGHFLGGFFKLVLEVQERGQSRLCDFDQGLFGTELDFLAPGLRCTIDIPLATAEDTALPPAP